MTDSSSTKRLRTIWEKYLDLNMSDRKLCSVSQDLYHFICAKNSDTAVFGNIPKHLGGSSKDGAAIARWFKDCGQTLIEWDIMYNIARIYCSCRGTVDEMLRPGYVTVRSMDQKGRGNCIFSENDAGFKTVLNGNRNINGEEVKKIFQKYLGDIILIPATKKIIQEAFEKVLEGGFGFVTLKQEGVSIVFEIENKGRRVNFSCDNIASIYCQINWPERAKHWKDFEDHNNMKFVTREVAEKIQNSGCHVVPKTLPNNDEAWRWSLSKAESAVVQQLSPQQHIAYLICKVLFYSKLSKLTNCNDEVLMSFSVKNAMFNVFADTGSRHNEHSDGNADILYDIIPLTIILLEYIKDALQKIQPYMKHFFLKGVNVLHQLSKTFGMQVAEELQNIIDDITDPAVSVPCNIDVIIEKVNSIKKREQAYKKSKAQVKFEAKTAIMNNARKLPKTNDMLVIGIEKINKLKDMFKDIDTNKHQKMYFGDGKTLEMYKGGFRLCAMHETNSIKSLLDETHNSATQLQGNASNVDTFKNVLSKHPAINTHNLDRSEIDDIATKLHREEKQVHVKGIDFFRYSGSHNKPWYYSSQRMPNGDPIPMPGTTVYLTRRAVGPLDEEEQCSLL